MVKLKDGRYIKILEIGSQNFSNKKPKDRNNIIQAFARWANVSPMSFQLKVVTEKTDISSLMEQINLKTINEKDPNVLRGKKDYVNLVKSLSANESSGKRFFLIIEYEGNVFNNQRRATDVRQIANDMQQATQSINNYFHAMGNPIVDRSDENEFLEEFLYRFICKRSSVNETIRMRKQRLVRDMRLIWSLQHPGEVMSARPMPSLNAVISPRGIDFSHASYCVIDGICYTFIFIRNDAYPTPVYANWTACLDFGEGVDLDMYFVKQEKEKVIGELGRTLMRGKANLKNKNEEDKLDLEDSINAGTFIQTRLRGNEDLFLGVTMITIWDYSLQQMKLKKGQVMSRLNSNGIKTLPVLMECDAAYKMALPMLSINRHLFTKFQRNFLTSSMVSMYPFNELRINDEGGTVLGLAGNSLAVYNNFNTKRYNNANMGIFGPSGSGKTYTVLTMARRFRLNDIGVLFILPIKGHEYKAAIEDMGGLFLNLSPGSSICLNIMALHAEADIDAAILAEEEVTARSKLQQQITQVITFIQLLLKEEKLTSTQESELETVLTELYMDFGITHDNLSLYNAQGNVKPMPILSDLNERCIDNVQLQNVVSILKPFITGNCKNMNGQTNINLDNKMVGFDVSYAGDRYLPAFMFLALVYCYDKIKENVYDLYALFLDETWKFTINEMAESYVNELIKILRGYGGAAIISTQNIADIVKGNFGESIIDNCATKFLLKAGEKEAEIFKQLFNLSEEEIKEIMKQQKGHITMLANGEKVSVTIKTSSMEFALYTTDPNEKKKLRQQRLKNNEDAVDESYI